MEVRQLRNLKNKGAFWNYCKQNKNPSEHPNINFDDFTNLFKKLNKSDIIPEQNNIPNTNLNYQENKEIDDDINEEEIVKAINSLKNNKATGIDYIANEYIKATKDIMLPIYKTIFNTIYTYGVVPTSWT